MMSGYNLDFCSPRVSFALWKDLGTITRTTSPVVFAIGAYRSPSISFVNPIGVTQQRYPLFAMNYTTISDVVSMRAFGFMHRFSSMHLSSRSTHSSPISKVLNPERMIWIRKYSVRSAKDQMSIKT